MIVAPPKLNPRGAFTLLEVILAMSIVAIISSVIFSVTTSSMSLSQSIVATQAESRHQAAFNAYLTQLFSNLPPEAKITLEENDFQSWTLKIENPETAFPAQGRQHIAKVLRLRGKTDRDGLLYLELSASNQLENEAYELPPVTFETDLVRSLSNIRWEIFDQTRGQWSVDWVESMGRPSQIKFFYSYPGIDEEYSRYFWIPNKKNPV